MIINNVNVYIENFSLDVQDIMNKIRMCIKRKAPEADECIAYGMPAYKLYGRPLIYFAGFKKHIGLYATPSGHSEFEKELSVYKHGKGSVQFPIDKPIPYNLIERIVEYRIMEIKMDIKQKK